MTHGLAVIVAATTPGFLSSQCSLASSRDASLHGRWFSGPCLPSSCLYAKELWWAICLGSHFVVSGDAFIDALADGGLSPTMMVGTDSVACAALLRYHRLTSD
jgi:hypothetical protein